MDPGIALQFIIGLVLLVAGGESLVRGAVGLARGIGVSALIAPLILDAVDHDSLAAFSAVTLAVVTVRAVRSRSRPAVEGAA